MTEATPYWSRFTHGQLPPGDELAALRRGVGRDPGSVPAMWRFYTTLRGDGARSTSLIAEHLALTLYATHQQSVRELVHREGIGLGTAILALRNSGRFSPDAVDRRFGAAATATSIAELGVHLRGLITQLRGLDRLQPLDYTALTRDLRQWQYPESAPGVRRRWGAQYFTRDHTPTTSPA